MQPKVLIGSPTAKIKDYCFNAWIKNIQSFTYPDFDVLIVDNTNDSGEYARKIALTFPVMHINNIPGEDNYNLVTRAQNVIRWFFLKNNYDYLFMLESDQFPPSNVIEYLLSLNKPVVSLQYFIGLSFDSKLLQCEIEDFGNFRKSKLINLDSSFFNWKGKTWTKYQTGLGCILIRADVLKKIPFRIDKENTENAHSDVYFHEDLNKFGIPNYVSEVSIVYHQNKSWGVVKKALGQEK